jgi:dihydroxy-acid dehydratase
MFTANSMNCLCEALGMALPTNGTVLATSAERKRLFRRAAQRVIEMVLELERVGEGHGLLPREIITAKSIDNSMILDMAMGGSTNTVLHMLALANEAGIAYDIERINTLSKATPNICKVSPSSSYHVEDVNNSGGIHTILGSVDRGRPGMLQLDCPTVTGKTLGQNIAEFDIRGKSVGQEALELSAVTAGHARTNQGLGVERKAKSVRDLSKEELGFDPYDCIREVDTAYSKEGGLVILYGNVAPKGAVVKAAGVRPEMMRHRGPAVMQEMLAATTAIKGMQLDDKVALITDGRFSGGTAGASIGHISPEAASGGPIALLRDGDMIEIDIHNHVLNAEVSEAELAARAKGWTPPAPRYTKGILGKYSAMATSADTGGVMKWN